MSDFFGNLRGARFPDVVMNSGPLPPSGGLPAPLHDTPDGKINYNSTLLGDLQPYAYGEPAYQSSQNAYLNTPHRVQKIVPLLFLPEPDGGDLFRLSHAIDDSDLAFVMRLNRQSIFCTGTKVASRRTGLGTVIDPFVNLPTLNYILAGVQNMPAVPDKKNLWWELLFNLDPNYWPEVGKHRTYLKHVDEPVNAGLKRLSDIELVDHYTKGFTFASCPQTSYGDASPITMKDLIHLVRKCIRPFGIVRGSEKQGGQNEMTNSPATWPVPAIATLVIDGKEGNIVNIWQNQNVHAGDDLVLRFKLMPIGTYTLNHYYKGFVRKSFGSKIQYAWQLVPDVYNLDVTTTVQTDWEKAKNFISRDRTYLDFIKRMYLIYMPYIYKNKNDKGANNERYLLEIMDDTQISVYWQEIGYWHIGRSQVMMSACGTDDFYNNDMANSLKTNHMEMTFQPTFCSLPIIVKKIKNYTEGTRPITKTGGNMIEKEKDEWNPSLKLETKYVPQRIRKEQVKFNRYQWDLTERMNNEMMAKTARQEQRNKMMKLWTQTEATEAWNVNGSEIAKRYLEPIVQQIDAWEPSAPVNTGGTSENAWGTNTQERAWEPIVPTNTWEPIVPTNTWEENMPTNTWEENMPTNTWETPKKDTAQELKVTQEEPREPTDEIKIKQEDESTPSIQTPGLNGTNKKPRPKGRKNATTVVEGTLLKPGAASESCAMQLL